MSKASASDGRASIGSRLTRRGICGCSARLTLRRALAAVWLLGRAHLRALELADVRHGRRRTGASNGRDRCCRRRPSISLARPSARGVRSRAREVRRRQRCHPRFGDALSCWARARRLRRPGSRFDFRASGQRERCRESAGSLTLAQLDLTANPPTPAFSIVVPTFRRPDALREDPHRV